MSGAAPLPPQPQDEQQALLAAVERFGRSLNAGRAAREAARTFDRETWRAIGEVGLFGLPIPERYGGSAQNVTATARAMMALGRACRDNGLVFSLNAQLWAFQMPVLRFGTEEQRQRYLVPACRGEIVGAHAVSEPSSGSDAMSMRARARKLPEGAGYVLDGRKTFVTNGPAADVVLVFATVAPERRSAGITGFLVPRGTPGLTLSAPIPKMGQHSSPMGDVILEACHVPATARLGAEGAGASIFSAAMEWERTCIFAAHLGAMERLLDDCIRYTREREQFGQAIGRFPEIASKLVDMKVNIEAGRLLLLHAAAEKDAGRSAILHAAMAKLFVSEAHLRAALDAVQVHGGYGYCTELGIERELRDAVPGTLYSGTSEMQRKIIARLMGLGA
jgi:alkylation response protein AidB-like acyl-CoA dehydrogenase